ncbi:hypothetical protein BC834DRAFT_879734, partial [Gloeopeniophorella convolvens]
MKLPSSPTGESTSRSPTHLPSTREYTYIGHDHPRELPLKVGIVNARFEDDTEHYAVDHNVRSWTEWNSIRPRATDT